MPWSTRCASSSAVATTLERQSLVRGARIDAHPFLVPRPIVRRHREPTLWTSRPSFPLPARGRVVRHSRARPWRRALAPIRDGGWSKPGSSSCLAFSFPPNQ